MPEPNKNEPPLDLSTIQQMFEDDNVALQEFFEALLDDLEVVRQDFVNAANNLDPKGFHDALHKVKSFVRIFQPTQLMDAMERARAVYKNEEWEKLPEANQHILEEMARVTAFLKKNMQPNGG